MAEPLITDWIGAIATVVAAAGACLGAAGAIGAWGNAQRQLVVVRQQTKDAKDNFDKLDAARTAERADAAAKAEWAQAEQVCFWIGKFHGDVGNTNNLQIMKLSQNLLQIKNGSTLPVFDVRVVSSERIPRGHFEAIGPGETAFGGEVGRIKVDAITFRDGRSRSWRRNCNGTLEPWDGKTAAPEAGAS